MMTGTARLTLNLYLLTKEATPFDTVPSLQTSELTASAALTTAADEEEGYSGPRVTSWVWEVDELRASGLPEDRRTPAVVVRSAPSQPAWLEVLRTAHPTLPLGHPGENVGCLFFQPVGHQVLLWSFGSGWGLIELSKTVPRFGLRVGLNALLTAQATSGEADPIGVRGLTSAVRAAVVRSATVHTARPAAPSTIERIDQTSDAARMAELTTHHPIFTRVAAGRSLRFDALVRDEHDLFRYGREALRLHRRDDYTSDADYRWIDNTVPVATRKEQDEILDALWKASRGHGDAIGFIWAEAVSLAGETPTTLRLPRERDKGRVGFTWAAASRWLAAEQPKAAGHEALRIPIRWFVKDSLVYSTELWEHLVAQIDVGGQTYVVSDGEIWATTESYLKDLHDDLSQHVDVNPTYLPRFKSEDDEDTYNRRAAQAHSHLLLDKQLIRPKGHTGIEVGDLLAVDGRLMHVKRKSRSSALSHVTAQATASIQLLRSDGVARRLLDDMVSRVAEAQGSLGKRAVVSLQKHCESLGGQPTLTVEIVIVGLWKGSPSVDQLPLLTRLNLSSWARQLPVARRIVLVGA